MRELADVGAGDERLVAGAGENDAAHRRVVARILEGRAQVLPGGRGSASYSPSNDRPPLRGSERSDITTSRVTLGSCGMRSRSRGDEVVVDQKHR